MAPEDVILSHTGVAGLPRWRSDLATYQGEFLTPLVNSIRGAILDSSWTERNDLLAQLGVSRRYETAHLGYLVSIVRYATHSADSKEKSRLAAPARRQISPVLISLIARWVDETLRLPLEHRFPVTYDEGRGGPTDVRNLKFVIGMEAIVAYLDDVGTTFESDFQVGGIQDVGVNDRRCWTGIARFVQDNNRTPRPRPAPRTSRSRVLKMAEYCRVFSGDSRFWCFLFSRYIHIQRFELEPQVTEDPQERSALLRNLDKAQDTCRQLRPCNDLLARICDGLDSFLHYVESNPDLLGGKGRRGYNGFWQWGRQFFEDMQGLDPDFAKWLLRRRSDSNKSDSYYVPNYLEMLALMQRLDDACDLTESVPVIGDILEGAFIQEPNAALKALFYSHEVPA